MRVVCCLDGTNIEQVIAALSTLVKAEEQTVGLLYVTDTGPHTEINRTRERFLRRSGPLSPRRDQMQEADETAAQDILNEGQRYLPHAELLRRVGRPEREIVNCAAAWSADLLIICPHTHYGGKPELGPKSVGHVARFVLDHAPCPVLLVRPLTRGQFPISR